MKNFKNNREDKKEMKEIPFINCKYLNKNFDITLSNSIIEQLKEDKNKDKPLFFIIMQFCLNDVDALMYNKWWATIFRLISSLEYNSVVYNLQYIKISFNSVLSKFLLEKILTEFFNFSVLYEKKDLPEQISQTFREISFKTLNEWDSYILDATSKNILDLSGLKWKEFLCIHILFLYFSIYIKFRFQTVYE